MQIGSDDALVAFHALRALLKEAGDAAKVRWQMNGFNRSPGATARPMTARNLMGQVDGTNNPKPSEPDFDRRIFVPAKPPAGTPDWMAGGSYAVVRRIRMLLDDWEALPADRQELVIGRRKSDGAPLTGGTETTALDLDRTGPDGRLVIPENAHARISAPEQNGGAAMLRRPFSFHDGIAADGAPDAGLLFVCWQADPLRGFVPVQRKLDRGTRCRRSYGTSRAGCTRCRADRARASTWASVCWSPEAGRSRPTMRVPMPVPGPVLRCPPAGLK